MVVWIERALALAIHGRQVAEHGGDAGVRDEALLESALARPKQLHAYGDPTPDLANLAASLTYGLARNHPSVDGNKRTAAVACETFLVINGAQLDADDLALYPMYVMLAAGEISEEAFAEWLRGHVRVRRRGGVNEPRVRYG